jgi:hypothetical protein
VDKNTVSNEDLLTAIKTNTAMDALIASQKIGDLKTAGVTAGNIEREYGVKVSGSYNVGDYQLTDPNDSSKITGYNISGIQNQIDKIQSADSTKLQQTEETKSIVDSLTGYIGGDGKRILTDFTSGGETFLTER